VADQFPECFSSSANDRSSNHFSRDPFSRAARREVISDHSSPGVGCTNGRSSKTPKESAGYGGSACEHQVIDVVTIKVGSANRSVATCSSPGSARHVLWIEGRGLSRKDSKVRLQRFHGEFVNPCTDNLVGLSDCALKARLIKIDSLNSSVRWKHSPTPGNCSNMRDPIHEVSRACAISHVLLMLPGKAGSIRAECNIIRLPTGALAANLNR
jgi:hypothetical protein